MGARKLKAPVPSEPCLLLVGGNVTRGQPPPRGKPPYWASGLGRNVRGKAPLVFGKTTPFAGRRRNEGLRPAYARRRHSRPAWRCAGDNRVLERRNEEGLHAVARNLHLGPLGAQASKGVCGSLLRLVERLKNGTRGRRLSRKREDHAANEAGALREHSNPHGRGPTARNGCAHGSCCCRSRKATSDPKKRSRVTLPTVGGPAAWPRI